MDPEILRIMPQAVNSENYVIGSILLSGINALEQTVEILSDEMFYNNANAILYKTFTDMQAETMAIDLPSVNEWMLKAKTLDDCGGPGYIAELTSNIASGTHVAAHAEIVRDKYMRRELIKAACEAYNGGYDASAGIDYTVAQYESGIQKVQELMAGRRSASHIRGIVTGVIKDAWKRASDKREGRDPGITTGLADLDRKLSGGWKAPDFIVLAARPSVGKTAISIHMAERAARSGIPVLYVSLEMSKNQLVERMVIGKSDVDAYAYKSGCSSNEDLARAEDIAFREIARLPLHVEDNPSRTVVAVMSQARVMQRRGMCGLLIIDYLQLLTPVSGQNREQEISGISRALKLGAKQLGIPVIALSQQNRKGGADLATLRDSGAIEQDADIVIFIERKTKDNNVEMVDENNIPLPDNIIRLSIGKNRNGETGNVFITHNSSFTAFYDYDYSRNRKRVSTTQYVDPDRFHEPAGEMPF